MPKEFVKCPVCPAQFEDQFACDRHQALVHVGFPKVPQHLFNPNPILADILGRPDQDD